jgi:hypothetical protein
MNSASYKPCWLCLKDLERGKTDILYVLVGNKYVGFMHDDEQLIGMSFSEHAGVVCPKHSNGQTVSEPAVSGTAAPRNELLYPVW